jgi:hypothetical protein
MAGLTVGDKGMTEDGIEWVIGSRGVAIYIEECGGCGGTYVTYDIQRAYDRACNGCGGGAYAPNSEGTDYA